METMIEKIKSLLEESNEKEIKKSSLLWVDNYKVFGIELPIAIFLSQNADYILFITGVTVFKLKREYKNMTDYETIAKAIWKKYTHQ